MGEVERTSGIPNSQLDAVDKSTCSTTEKQEDNTNGVVNEKQGKAVSKPSDTNSTANEVHVGARSPGKYALTSPKSGDSSASVANGCHPSNKGTSEKPSGTENHSSRTASIGTSALSMPTLAPTDTGGVSTASNNTIDCNDTHTNESTSTLPDSQSRQSKKETIVYDDSQETTQSQMVVTVPQQQTVYYQIPQLPSVVTLPVESSPDVVAKTDGIDQQQPIEQQQIQYTTNEHQIAVAQSHLPIQTEDQIIGMVGAIPIIKMQGGGMHYVKERKGRFNLLQTTPVIPNVVGVASSASNESRNSTSAQISNASNSRSQSPAPVVTANSSAQTGPQTFDGKSAPTVKRKGRFVVTNVKDPGSIIQIQTKSVPGVAVATATDSSVTSSHQDPPPPPQQQQQQQKQHEEQHQQAQPQIVQQQQYQSRHQSQEQIQQPIQQSVQQQAQQQVQQQVQQKSYHQMSPLQTPMQNPSIPMMEQTLQQPNISQIPLQPVVIQPVSTIQQTYEIPKQYQQNYAHHSVSTSQGHPEQYSQVPLRHYTQNIQPQTVQYATVHPPTRQQNYVQYVPQVQHALYSSNQPTHNTGQQLSVAVTQEHQVLYNQQYQQQIPQQEYSPRPSYVQTQQIHPSPSLPANQQTIPKNRYTSTPPTTPGGSTSSPMHSRPAATSTLPNAPIPKPTTATLEKQQTTKPVAKKKTTIQGRSGKVPQSFDSNGTSSSIGLGRAFYLMEQMKTEVTDADQSIKTLQTDMKLLRDKIKDLESKNKELEIKLREEQALREKTEIRNMDLRKKLREARDEVKTLKLLPTKTSKDENENSRHSSDAITDKPSNTNFAGKEAKPSASSVKSPKQARNSSNSVTVSGASPKRNVATTDTAIKPGSSHSHINISQIPSTPPASKLNGSNSSSSLNVPKIDLNLKEQPELKNGTDSGRMIRPRGAGKESEPRRALSIERTTGTKSANEKGEGSHRRIESMHTLGTPPLVPPLRSHTTGMKSTGHKHTQSLHEFDPLKSTVPVLSFPAPLSFETVPIKTSPTSESVPLPQYMSQNSVVMPVSFGMSPTAVSTTDGGFRRSPSPISERRTLVANNYHHQGLHEQQFMVVPQQQHVVLNQMTYPTQQRSNTIQNHQYPMQQQNTQHQPFRGHIQQQTHQHHQTQHRSNNQQTYSTSANPFDPFS